MTDRPSPQPHAITIKDIAAACGVHNTTVSLALRGDTRISEATRARVQAAADTLGYRPSLHAAARRMRFSKANQRLINHAIGLIFPADFTGKPFFAELFRGTLDELTAQGFGVFVQGHAVYAAPPNTAAPPMVPLPIFDRGELDGLIAVTDAVLLATLPELRANPGFADRPIVSLIKAADGCSAIVADEYAGAYQVATHLLDFGHRHLLFFLYGDDTDDRDGRRLDGTLQAVRDFGLDPAQHLHRFVPSAPFPWLDPVTARKPADLHVEQRVVLEADGARLLAYLQAHPQISALLLLNDAMAQHVWFCLQQAGRQVPGDYSLVGFDDTDPMLNEIGHNLLTTVHVPLAEMGQAAARLLIAHLTSDAAPSQHLMLPTQLVIRNSTAPPRR